MALTENNTFQVPKSEQFLSVSRGYFNNTLKTLMRNFTSANAVPDTSNIIVEGTNQTPGSGMLWYNTTTGKIYLNTSTTYSSSNPVFGNFTRLGVATTQVTNLASVNLSHYDPGELLVVINDTAGSSANNRLYMVTEAGGSKTVIDVGIPVAASVAPSALDSELGPITFTAFMQG